MITIPHELIRDVKIRTRAAAGLPDYDPSDPTLPSLPSLSAEVATLDPSSTDLRCENCKGRLLRGSESLICVYCGRVPRNDVVREPVSFNATVGHTWLLRSLGLDGSELVEPHKIKSEQDKRQNFPSPPIPLSEFLNFKIPWPAETGNQETGVSDKHLSHSPLSFTGVALDNFIVKSQVEAVLSEQKSTGNPIETGLHKDVHTRDSQSLSLSVRSFEAAKSFLEDETGEAQWEADFQSADLNNNRQILTDSGNTFPDSQPLKPSMDIEQLRSNTGNVIPDRSMEQKIMHDHVGTSGNKDIAARDGYDLFQKVQSHEGVGSSTKEKVSEAFSEWDADFQSAALDNMDGNFKSSDHVTRSLSDSENKFQDSQPFNHFTGLEDNFAAHIDSVLGPGKDPDDGKVKDTPVASATFDDWNSDGLWNNLSSKNSRSVGEFDASTSTKNHVDDHAYKDSHDSSATSDFFEDFQWQNKGSDMIIKKSNNEEVEKKDEDLVEGWGNFTGLDSLEVSSEAKIANIEDVKTKDEPIDEGSFDEWGGFAGSSLQTSEINSVGLKENKTQDGEHETANDDSFDEWGNFGSFNVSSETKNASVAEIMTENEKHRPMNEEQLKGWSDFTTPASLQVPSETKGSNMIYREKRSVDHTEADDDLFKGWGNFTSSTGMKISSESKSADMTEIKTEEEEHMNMDDDLFEGWGNFTTSTNLQASSETKSADILESVIKVEETTKVNDDYAFEGWDDFNKSNNVELKPMDDDPFGWSGFTGSTNLQVSSVNKLDQLNNEVSTSDQRSSEMDFFNWDNRHQGSGFDGFPQPTSTDQKINVLTEDNNGLSEISTSDRLNGTTSSLPLDSSKATKPADSPEKSNQDEDDVMTLISQMHDLSFMLADELHIPSTSNSSSKD